LVRIFQYLPADLLDAIRVCITAIGIIAADARRRAPGIALDAFPRIGDSESPRPIVAEEHDEDEVLYEEAPFAVMRHSFCPPMATAAGGPLRDGGAALRRTETLVNSACGELFGMNAEELLARIGGHDLPEHFCELDHLLLILENLYYYMPTILTYVQRFRLQFPGQSS
jgi:hypothetical protein